MVKRFSWQLLVILAVLFSLLSGCSGASGQSMSLTTPTTTQSLPSPSILTSKPIGIAMGGDLPTLSESELKRRLKLVKDLGVDTIRFDADWSLLQPTQATQYNWEPFDLIFKAVKAENIKVLALLDCTPSWASADTTRDPCNVQPDPSHFGEFAQFSQAVVERYSDQGLVALEVWNEPGSDLKWKSPRVQDYAKMFTEVAKAVHKVKQTLPVITGGLTPEIDEPGFIAPGTFVDKFLALVDKNEVGGIGMHPYTPGILPSQREWWSGVSQLVGNVPLHNGELSVQDALKKHSMEKLPVYLTEYGAPTGGIGPDSSKVVSEEFHAKMLYEYLNYEFTLKVTRFVYTLTDNTPSDYKDSPESHYGLYHIDGTLKPGGEQVKKFASAA